MSRPGPLRAGRALRRAAVLLALLTAAGARAGEGGEAGGAGQAGSAGGAPETAQPPAPAPEGESPAPGKPPDLSPSLDFDLLPPPPPAPAGRDAKLERQVKRRRAMLGLHQGLGLALLGGLAATTVVGQLDFDDRFRGGGDAGTYHGWHRGLAIGTGAAFASVGLLGLLAPEPYEQRGARLDTATVHKASMAIATAGMATQIALGLLARRSAGELRERDLATAHQVTGYATLAAVTAGAVVLVF